jgi:hypothetical protein
MAMSPEQELEDELVNFPQNVLIITGAGVALSADARSSYACWSGLLLDALDFCKQRCDSIRDADWFETTRRLIGEKSAEGFVIAASRIRDALDTKHPSLFGNWLEQSVGRLQLRDRRLTAAIAGLGVRIATMNYDSLLEQESGLTTITWSHRRLALAFLQGRCDGILHLHGYFGEPGAIVFSASNYEDICRDSQTRAMLRTCFMRDTIVFVGCGGTLNDPHFKTLFNFARESLKESPHGHFLLARKSERAALDAEYAGLPIQVVGYGDDYDELPTFLSGLAQRVAARQQARTQIDVLTQTQIDFENGLRELQQRRSATPPSEYVRRVFELSQHLRDAGGRRRAVDAMSEAVSENWLQLSADHRVEFGLEVVTRLLDDGLEDYAAMRLEAISNVLDDHTPSASALARFRNLVTRLQESRSTVDQTLEAIEEEKRIGLPGDRERLDVEQAEVQFLAGRLDELSMTTVVGEMK